jgi:hypothetical protein
MKKNVGFFGSKSAYNKEILAVHEKTKFSHIKERHLIEKKNVGFFGSKSANNKEILAVHEKTKFSYIKERLNVLQLVKVQKNNT